MKHAIKTVGAFIARLIDDIEYDAHNHGRY